MKYTLVRGLALTLGVCTIPNAAFAQYTLGEPAPTQSSGAYIPLPAPSIPSPPVAAGSGVASMMIPASQIAYQNPGSIGSGVPVAIPQSPNAINSPFASTNYPAPPSQFSQPQPNNLILGRNVAQQSEQLVAPGAVANATSGGPSSQSAPLASESHSDVSSSASCNDTCYAPPIQTLNPWIVGGNALVFNRLDNECVALTRNSNDTSYPLLCVSQVDMPTTGGFEVFGGRYFGCGRYALVGSYWGVFAQQQEATITASPGIDLTSALPFTIATPPGGAVTGIQTSSQFVADWFDGAAAHRVLRQESFQNFELNFISFALGGGARQPYTCEQEPGFLGSHHGKYADGRGTAPTGAAAPWYGAQSSRLRLNMYGGFRWFQYRDNLRFEASEFDTIFDYSADDFSYQNEVTNNLFGGQLGAMATWCTGHRVNLWGGTSFGVYNNSMSMTSFAGTSSETATVLSSNIFNGQPYSFTSHGNDLALLGEGSTGVGIRISRGWTALIGYRLIGVSGLATSTSQIPRDFSNLNGAWNFHNNNSVLLGGLTVGAAYNF